MYIRVYVGYIMYTRLSPSRYVYTHIYLRIPVYNLIKGESRARALKAAKNYDINI